MATYFHGNSEIQGGGGADGLQTLVLMNPGYIQYSDTPPPPPQHGGNLVFFNSATAVATTAGNNSLHSGQQFVGIPLSTAAEQSMYSHHDVSSNAMVAMHGFAQRGHYNLWNTIDSNTGARDATRATQGLSLSLPAMSGDDVRVSGGSPSSASGITNVVVGGGGGGVSGIQSVLLSSKYLKATQELLEEVVNVNNNNGVNKGDSNNNEQKIKKSFEKNKVVGESSHASDGGDGSVGEGSGGKHESELSPIERQEIQMKKAKLIAMLDEVEQRYRQYHNHMQIVISLFEQAAGIGSARTYTALALKTISKQFRCLKECITGQIKAANKSLGSGSSEDNDNNNNDDYNKVIEGVSVGSRLKYVDHHLRQQRAIQQLGMIHHQHNAWRPQRGLPERSVSVLRAWLFEHFLHPYPKDSDKHMLAKQTGLTRSQVSNWFINARVRLWKPMVEEMYLEEMKDHEMNNNNNNNGSEDKSSKNSEDPAMKTSSTTQEKGPNSETEHRSFNSKQDVSPIVSVSTQLSSLRNSNNNSGFSFNIGSSSELDGITQGSPKKPRTNNNNEIMHNNSIISIDMKPNNIDSNCDQLSMKFGGGDDNDDEDHRQGRDSTNGYSFIGNQTNFISSFGQYPIEEITRFDVAEQFTTPPTRFSISSSGNSNNNNSNNNVSLTLGLPHCDTISGTHQTFLQNQNIQLGMRLEMSETSEFGASSAAFESINNMQNPKRFAAQLLPDFVA